MEIWTIGILCNAMLAGACVGGFDCNFLRIITAGISFVNCLALYALSLRVTEAEK